MSLRSSTNIHGVINVKVSREAIPTDTRASGAMHLVDIVITDSNGGKYELTLFHADDAVIPVEVEGAVSCQ
jgi:hypothetical protein